MRTETFIWSIAGMTTGLGLGLLIAFGAGLTIISTFVDNPKQVKKFVSIATFVTSILWYVMLLLENPAINDFDEYYFFSVVLAIYWGCLLMWGIAKLFVFLGNGIDRWFDKNVVPKLKEKAGYEDKKRFARFVVKSIFKITPPSANAFNSDDT